MDTNYAANKRQQSLQIDGWDPEFSKLNAP